MTDEIRPADNSTLAVLRDKDGTWLRTLYVEAWKQYSHEDALAQARSNVFLVIQAILLAFLAALSTAAGRFGCATVADWTFNLGVTVLGMIWILIAVLLFLLATRFQKICDAGQVYVNLRHMNVRAIERLSGVGVFGPALLEHAFREFQPTPSGEKFEPFKSYTELSSYQDLAVTSYPNFGGFTYFAPSSEYGALCIAWFFPSD